jgi:hypothetical protein
MRGVPLPAARAIDCALGSRTTRRIDQHEGNPFTAYRVAGLRASQKVAAARVRATTHDGETSHDSFEPDVPTSAPGRYQLLDIHWHARAEAMVPVRALREFLQCL